MTQQGAARGIEPLPVQWSTQGPWLYAAPPVLDVPRPAAWSRRVIATILDEALLAAVTWWAFPVQHVAPPQIAFAFDAAGATGTTTGPVAWAVSGWVVASLVTLLAMQAYLGSTPGKLLLGIAIVGEADARPVGLARTVLRWIAHVLDAFLFIGYLRPLWNARGQTFADSLAGTQALHTRRPLPHPWLARRSPPAGPADRQAVVAPPWRWVATVVAVPVCLAGVVLAGSTTGTSAAWSTGCGPSGSALQGQLADASVSWNPPVVTETRGWVSRTRATDGGLELTGPSVASTGRLRVVVVTPEGTRRELSQPGAVDDDVAPGTVVLDAAEVGALAPGTSLRFVLQDADGTVLGTCETVAP